ncbi:MAG: response regulator, partial [Pseudomonadota bacterium]
GREQTCMLEKKMAKILVVEDEAEIRQLLIELVENAGHSAFGAGNGLLGWNLLKDNADVTLVITDIRMPEHDGRELIAKIRADSGLADLPVIIISGAVGPKEISDLLSMGATAFLPKPIGPGELENYLKRYLA